MQKRSHSNSTFSSNVNLFPEKLVYTKKSQKTSIFLAPFRAVYALDL